ncbi:WYL domain-containing protein [Desulfogranum mediterraneum]|uniref:WYL domain-containing protein n=1 Tax=Desulfogranum mediterraneum TaxID=160661 RepID=UPI00137663F8|nr:WYL domain-containing protein [Desulfogranum mediterraneum]
MRWSAEKRLEFIEARLFWEGKIGRKDLTEFFRISIPQATKDIKEYIERAPKNIDYDNKSRQYIATPDFKPVLSQPSSERYLGRLKLLHKIESGTFFNGSIPSYAVMPTARRFVDTDILREILRSVRDNEAINITYQSMTSPKPKARWISPHAIGNDGSRWHVRALCHSSKIYKDFNIGRMLSINDSTPHDFDHSIDYEWHNTLEAKIEPNPQLDKYQKSLIERDYCMEDGCVIISLKAAFFYYFKLNFGFVEGYEELPPTRQQVVPVNLEELEAQATLLKSMTKKQTQKLSDDQFFA